jgi:hypothetical protein
MLHRGLLRPKTRERDAQVVEQPLDVARSQVHSDGGRWAVVISLLALALSFWGLYETALKQAQPSLHLGAVIYFVPDAEGSEAFAVPVTITNRGARDAVVAALDLQVSQAKPGAVATAFASTYVGSGGNIAKDKQPFTPLSIAGRGSYAGIVIFHPRDLKSRPKPVVAEGSQSYQFCLSARSEGAPSAATIFEAELPWFASRALDASQPIVLSIKPAKRDEGRNPQGKETEPACE